MDVVKQHDTSYTITLHIFRCRHSHLKLLENFSSK